MATGAASSATSSSTAPLQSTASNMLAPAPVKTVATCAPPATNKNFVFHVSLLYNMALRRIHTRPWWSRIEPHVVLGALPLREKRHMELLTQHEGVRAVVTMNQPRELLPNWLGTPVTPDDWAAANIPQCMGHTGDFSPPTLETIHACVAFLHAHVQQNHTTYVHCKAGRGRSTVVVLAYLMQHRGLSLDEAHAFVLARRRHISLHPKQRAVLTAFAASLVPSPSSSS